MRYKKTLGGQRECIEFSLRVGMMIFKRALPCHVEAPLLQVCGESVRIAYATERKPFRITRWRGRGGCVAIGAKQAVELRLRIENRRARIVANRRFDGGRVFTARDNDCIRAGHRAARLAKPAGRKKSSTAEGVRGVDQQYVHIAREFQVLETVVEHEPIDAFVSENASLFEAIRAYAELHAGRQARLKQANFVAG